MVADTLTYHPFVSHYLRFVATTVGRDKALRTLQYLARFLSWYLLRKGYTAASIAPWDAIKKNFGSTRKAMRIGKNVEHLKAASVALDDKTLAPIPKYLAALRQLCYAGYLTLDTLGFLAGTKIYTLTPTRTAWVQKEAQKLWLAGITCSLLHSAYKLQQLSSREGLLKKTDAEGKLEGDQIRKERQKLHTQLLLDGCDWVIPATGLGLTGFDEGLVGAAGFVSSWIGLRQQWEKTQ
ncbi:peroxisomal biogenesis factor 11 [Sphaerosporella brunnea]|uniref:Peroxisomal biogenesis factor 11 n=1 Tax=Sphaerosporella brunnea TaxID=1250544 RepID=A0A5J5EF46_9PEZI|nr:peroxisomal biogenesis factor 11 [Sphaerosporella brunnea]KAA8893861.1 peroxisomal biogenesis factor 11 [Sphaerosporella brunnea]